MQQVKITTAKADFYFKNALYYRASRPWLPLTGLRLPITNTSVGYPVGLLRIIFLSVLDLFAGIIGFTLYLV